MGTQTRKHSVTIKGGGRGKNATTKNHKGKSIAWSNGLRKDQNSVGQYSRGVYFPKNHPPFSFPIFNFSVSSNI